jgi:phenylacetate-CoA ligase
MGIYNKLLENIILPAGDAALGTSYMKDLREWRKIQYKSDAELKAMQRSDLHKLLTHATTNVPYFKKLGIAPEEDPYKWIKKLPIMYKKVIKENIDDMVLGDREKLIKLASSGSSGVQGVAYMTAKNQSRQLAVQTLWWEWAGYKLGNRILQTGITPNRGTVKTIKDNLLRTKYVSAYNLDQKEVAKLLRDAEKNPYDHFMGYASSLFVFANVAKENGINNVHFKSAVSWGDKLFPHFKTAINEQFHTNIFDTYGCGEGFMIAGQCPEKNFHIMTPLVYLEILDDDGNDVKPGELGKVVVTRLDNYVMPLIRYYLGDLAVIEDPEKRCSCGRQFPLMQRVVGRDTDIVKTASGKFMVVHAFTGIFEHVTEIRQFRVIQRNLEGIDIEVIPDQGYGEAVLNGVRKKIWDYLKEEYPVNFVEVDHIPSTSSGKPQIIQSFLKQSMSNSN